jgi:hypothetical protein
MSAATSPTSRRARTARAPADDVVERLRSLAEAVQAVVAARRAVDPAPDDPFRGLYLGDDEIDRLLSGEVPTVATQVPPPEAEADADAEHPGRLAVAAGRFGLDAVDVQLLLVALAPDVDGRFERYYGYLNDDVTRRRASVGLALELCGLPPVSGRARRRLTPAGPLIAGGLVTVEDADRPFLTRALRVPDRVTAHVLGVDDPDPAVAHLLSEPVALDVGGDDRLASVIGGAPSTTDALVYVAEAPGASGRSYAAAVLDRAGRPSLVVDLDRSGPDDWPGIVRVLALEARLRGAALVAGPVDAAIERGLGAEKAGDRGARAVRALAELPGLVVLCGRSTWDPHWSPRVPVLVTAAGPTAVERDRIWRAALDGHMSPGFDPTVATRQFRLGPEQVAQAAAAAVHQAELAGTAVGDEAIRSGARSRNSAGLERRARRIEPAVGWDDLVLPPACLAALLELSARVRHREQVLEGWAMRPGGGRGRGITGLFAGDSGTGKTMSAEVVAGDLGLDLYVVDLATVVDKYVGETEKNLERIFAEADGVNGVLLFDEADALFGKRSEVRDAHDRYANIEVAYLLQRMEAFDGLALLTTNLRANLDEAFTRRLDAIVDFPLPDVAQRRLLWERCLGRHVPRTDDVDLEFCAERFELAGGNIRSIALTSAYLCAARGERLSMADLMRATLREYRKLGRLCVRAEFGPWLDLG